MKSMIALYLVALIGLSLAEDLYPRGCIYIHGQCSEECPVGTHSYTTGCGYLTPEATCDNPHPVTDSSGEICDFTACYCDPPTVRDTATDKCVRLEECTKKVKPEEKEKPEKKEKPEEKEKPEKKEKEN